MRTISATEYTRMCATASASMFDTCVVQTYSATSSTSAEPNVGSWADGSAIACGFDASVSNEVSDGSQATLTDATIRLPIGTTCTGKNRIKVTKRNGTTLGTAETYEILGEPRRGPTALVCHCKRIVGTATP